MNTRLVLVETLDDAMQLKRWLGERREFLGIDTETSGLSFWKEKLRTVQFGDPTAGWVVPFEAGGWGGLAREILAEYEGPVALQNAKFDAHFLQNHGLRLRWDRVHDTRIMSHLLDPDSPTGLKPSAERYVDPNARLGEQQLKTVMQKMRWGWGDVPLQHPAYWMYSALDPVFTARLAEVHLPRVMEKHREIYDLELAVQQVLFRAERTGIRFDPGYCRTTADEWALKEQELRRQAKERWDIDNVTADQQVMKKLVEEGVNLTKRTPKGESFSVDKEVLAGVDHPLAQLVLDVKRLHKWRTTYLEKLLEDADGDVIHCSVNQLGARTGRTSIVDPPLQTLPRDASIRDAFVAWDDEHDLLLVDYDNMEMRVFAHFCQDAGMIALFNSGRDFFTETSRQLHSDDSIEKKDPRRQTTKNACYAKIYGAGVHKFATTAGVDLNEAAKIYTGLDALYPMMSRFMQRVYNVVQQRALEEGEGYVITPAGRRHPVPTGMAYKSTNYLTQGFAADLFKRAMVRFDLAGLGDLFLLPVHDEGVFNLPHYDADALEAEIVSQMEDHSLSAPLTVDPTRTRRWGNAYPREAIAV